MSLAAANCSTCSTTRLSVSALWSVRYTYRVSSAQLSSYRPRGAPAVMALSIAWLGTKSYHLGLPSFSAAVIRRLSRDRVLVLSTPSIWRSCHSSASTLLSVS
ncbi:hypothetical protein D3C85_1709700 [compost metagenome]